MALELKSRVLKRLTDLFGPRAAVAPELQQARALIAAVDKGGVPLFPGKVNQIARAMGLEVSSKAPVEETIARIREVLVRQG